MLSSALEHYARQQRLNAAGLRAALRDRDRGPVVAARTLAAFQFLAARDAVESVPLMLEEQALTAPSVGRVDPAAVAGVASDGRPLDTLLAQASNEAAFGLMVVTQMQDAARAAAGVGIASRPRVTGWVRMLVPPSCSRCAVLAGRFYRWNSGFPRHPKCDCRHIPSSEALAGDLTTNPAAYFDSLAAAEQDRVFTKAGAQAIRDGADIATVVNARRGMSTATTATGRRVLARERLGGRDVFVTRESSTRRGQANRGRTGRNMSARLMPETIYDIAGGNRDEAIRLLRLHGYLT